MPEMSFVRMCRHLPALLAALLLWAGIPALAEEPAPFAFPMHDQAPAPLGRVTISGNTHTDTTLILRILGFHEGQAVSRQDVDDAWDRLEDSGFFRTVDVGYDNSGDAVELEIVVEEDLQTYYGPLVRYDRRHKYLLGAYVEQRNFRGRGEKLRLEGAALYAQQTRLSWDRPWFLGRTGMSTHFEAAWMQGDFVFRPTRFRRGGFQATVRNIWGVIYAEGGGGWGAFTQRDPFTWPDAGAQAVSHPESSESHWVMTGAVGVDSRSNPYYPSRGVFLEGRLRRWSSDDFPSYLESTVDARIFVPVPLRHHILALRAWGRRTDEPVQLDNRLYLGGPGSVRGMPFGQIEGDEGYLLSAEYRVPLFIMPISPQGELVGLGLHFFGDAGNAWRHGAEAGRALQSAGAGLHLNLDTLQFRFEAARTSTGEWGFEFMDTLNF